MLDRAQAEEYEQLAIITEKPKYNVRVSSRRRPPPPIKWATMPLSEEAWAALEDVEQSGS